MPIGLLSPAMLGVFAEALALGMARSKPVVRSNEHRAALWQRSIIGVTRARRRRASEGGEGAALSVWLYNFSFCATSQKTNSQRIANRVSASAKGRHQSSMQILMSAATGVGYANAPWWSAIAIGLLFTAASFQEHFSRGRRRKLNRVTSLCLRYPTILPGAPGLEDRDHQLQAGRDRARDHVSFLVVPGVFRHRRFDLASRFTTDGCCLESLGNCAICTAHSVRLIYPTPDIEASRR